MLIWQFQQVHIAVMVTAAIAVVTIARDTLSPAVDIVKAISLSVAILVTHVD